MLNEGRAELELALDARLRDPAGQVHHNGMRRYLPILLTLAAAASPEPTVQPGAWDITSTFVDFSAPGVPGFVAHMIRGKSKAEHKQLSSGQGIAALLAPDPKARCSVESQTIAKGRYAQAVLCPQKDGAPVRVDRSGTYDASGFAGQALVSGTTAKGALRMVLSQRAARVGN